MTSTGKAATVKTLFAQVQPAAFFFINGSTENRLQYLLPSIATAIDFHHFHGDDHPQLRPECHKATTCRFWNATCNFQSEGWSVAAQSAAAGLGWARVSCDPSGNFWSLSILCGSLSFQENRILQHAPAPRPLALPTYTWAPARPYAFHGLSVNNSSHMPKCLGHPYIVAFGPDSTA